MYSDLLLPIGVITANALIDVLILNDVRSIDADVLEIGSVQHCHLNARENLGGIELPSFLDVSVDVMDVVPDGCWSDGLCVVLSLFEYIIDLVCNAECTMISAAFAAT